MEDRTTSVTEPIETTAAADGAGRATADATARRSPMARAKVLLGSTAVRVGFVLLAVALGGYAIADEWSQVRAGIAGLGPVVVAGAFGLVLASLLASMLEWRALLTAAGSRVPLAPAARIFFVGQVGKYLPGAVWPVLAQMELGQAQRIPRRRSATVAVITILVSLAAGLIVAAICTVAGLTGSTTAGYGWAFVAAPVLLVALHPRVLNPAIDRLLRLARRPVQEVPLSGRAVISATLWAVLYWVLNGLSVWLLAVRLGAPDGRTFLLATGGFAFAWCAGFLVVLAPAGAGVREVVLVASLSPVLGGGKAISVALVSRLLTTVGDLLAAGLAGWLGRGRRNASEAAAN
ncbi:lysylphosphatidylglycerol synthase transmembrane domain-containing protein [Actinocrinis sp.]|uniref:lysylphosphatidylglycerol synthase transmembrane domain-containing protein n=1 Tax=Actinocrinis sp. TaxID=1920516 RepID=UPI002BF69F2F|nr:lysylphosphatidylglycerol synthase transmembrane domain-containing protein [Actinocrinis sp.]HXR72754.1 lysylphosphatidylglycerol synthase transmembrane domain-containing protein [Actinocrinis sp.]